MSRKREKEMCESRKRLDNAMAMFFELNRIFLNKHNDIWYN